MRNLLGRNPSTSERLAKSRDSAMRCRRHCVAARHQVKLLSECPRCQTGFRTPALWSEGCCEKCGLTFKEMGRYPEFLTKNAIAKAKSLM